MNMEVFVDKCKISDRKAPQMACHITRLQVVYSNLLEWFLYFRAWNVRWTSNVKVSMQLLAYLFSETLKYVYYYYFFCFSSCAKIQVLLIEVKQIITHWLLCLEIGYCFCIFWSYQCWDLILMYLIFQNMRIVYIF